MNRRTATAFCAIAVVTAAVLIPAFAHEGHGKTESASWDPNAPKKVSPETALAIGLKTAEVDFGQVEEVMKLTGSVRARPDRLVAVSPRTAGIVRAISVQPGDSVKKGDALAEIESQELAKNIYELRRLEADYERLLSDVKKSESLVQSLEIEVPATSAAAALAETEAARLTASGDAVSANLLAQRKTDAIKLRADAGLKAVALNQAKTDVQSLRSQGSSTLRSVDALRALIPPAQAGDGSEVSVDAARPGLIRFLSPIDGVVVTRAAVVGQGVEAGAKVLMTCPPELYHILLP
ncbi:MAG: efflux RND transporter periplasmic adaptor subunit [Phycisphaerales bacterium]|jgi:cobalt-zinc-cadmium efflux system membrane fusion protein